ncbi:MAG: arginine--tRNA ligase [Oscillospiraceae bacterium]|nr:arginine--tRNA ligase [Oscillospiraceae bacterium]
MANLIEEAKTRIDALLRDACRRAAAEGLFPEGAELRGTVEIPKDARNGDYAANHAMAGAKAMKMPPRKIAEILTEHLELEGSWFDSVEIAGPGFLNFRVSDKWYADVLAAVEAEGPAYGRAGSRTGEKVMVEFVSANPTGPMTIGNARGGVLGDTLATVLDMAGADVYREFYVNDAGNQVDKFGRSIDERYRELLSGDGDVRANLQRILDLRAADSDWEGFPEDAYHGLDIVDLAMEIIERDGNKYLALDEEARKQAFISYGLPKNIALMKEHLLRYGIEFDNWFLESSLHESGYVAETVDLLTENGHTYEKDGALWLRNTAFGAEKDEVLRRSNGFYTYYAVDLAYHRNKFVERGFDRVIDVWGADHHGHAIRFGKSMTAPELGLQGKKLDFLIMQMVRLTRDGETVKVSKRSGKALTLNDLLDEIGVDACRFFFNAKPDTHLEFDLDLAVRQDSENPVYYVQYAHARICSLLATLAAEGHPVPPAGSVNAALLREPQELDLLKQLAAFPEEILMAARDYDPSRVNRYAIELAARFHRFYNACRIRGAEEDVMGARLALSEATRSVIRTALTVIGVSAPEKM